MNAVIQETEQQATRRVFRRLLADGYRVTAGYLYRTADGEPWCRRIRFDHPNKLKEYRPLRWDGAQYVGTEPPKPAEGKPLYRLPELLPADSAALVWIVEGEKCADALAALDLIVTTSGSMSSAGGTDWTLLRGRHCLLWPDHDAPGSKYADEVAAILRALGCTVEVIDVEALDLPDKSDAVDWLAMHADATATDVLKLPRLAACEVAEPSAPSIFASAPEPLRRPLSPALEYPLDALGSLLGDAAKRIHAVVQAPAGLCGQSILAAASLAVQSHADVSISGSVEPLSLWHVSIGASGERKSAADHWALSAHVEFEREQAEAWRLAMAAHDVDLGAYKAAARAAEKKKDAAAIRNALHDLGAPPDAPLLPWLLLSEPTMEGLHKAYQYGRPGIGLFNDDAGDFLGGHAMNRDNRTKSAASFSKLWDNGRFDRVRAGDGAAKYYGRRLALHLMVQPIIAESVLSDDVLTGQGFLARCLLAWPASTIGTREYQDVDLSHDPDLARYWVRMRDLLAAAPPLQQGTRNELQPRVLTLAPDAMAYWIEVKNAIEQAMRGDYAGIHAWASKGGSQVARIAGVLTMAENPDAGVIHLDAIERATTLVMYHLDEAARIVGTASAPAPIKHAELLRAWCWETGRVLLYSTDALNKGPNAIRTVDTFNAALSALEGAGWAEWVDGGAVLDGKCRARVWRIRPESDQ
ncbi:YfjI family protein [Rhodanobacter sp. MP7CTX1]|uniref:DUF3987 domain-containing protein n=1 Tax=Rhodanobacter sp. MP7CTX1 TaxID=2723084 RepID=UPI0016228185|nr:YfjI family protein [Rhodanobacter sp. MP7CTX1]MBB6186190.1 hypothetical protein [Rhodanobacter sp. MP7CTX1]